MKTLGLAACAAALLFGGWYALQSDAPEVFEETPLVAPWDDGPLMAEVRSELAEREAWARNYAHQRAAMGEGEPMDQAAFRALQNEALSACLRQVALSEDTLHQTDARSGETTEFWDWETDRGSGAVAEADFEYHTIRPPAPPVGAVPAHILAAEEACASVDDVVAAIAASTTLVAPAATAPTVENALAARHFARAIGVRGRKAQREGRNGFVLVEQGLMALRDMRRGPTSLLQAMVVVASEDILIEDYASMLLQETQVDPDEQRRREDAITALLAASPSPRPLFESELLVVREDLDSEILNTRRHAQAIGSQPQVCQEDDTPFECLVRWNQADVHELLSATVPEQLKERVVDIFASNISYVRRLARVDADLDMLRALVRVSAARHEGCPPEARLEAPRWSEENPSVSGLSGHIYGLVAPASEWLDKRSVFLTLCPVPTPAWIAAD